jgi:hypothetical protein
MSEDVVTVSGCVSKTLLFAIIKWNKLDMYTQRNNSGTFERIWPFSFYQGNISNHGNQSSLDIPHPVTSERRNACRFSKYVYNDIIHNDNNKMLLA